MSGAIFFLLGLLVGAVLMAWEETRARRQGERAGRPVYPHGLDEVLAAEPACTATMHAYPEEAKAGDPCDCGEQTW